MTNVINDVVNENNYDDDKVDCRVCVKSLMITINLLKPFVSTTAPYSNRVEAFFKFECLVTVGDF